MTSLQALAQLARADRHHVSTMGTTGYHPAGDDSNFRDCTADEGHDQVRCATLQSPLVEDSEGPRRPSTPTNHPLSHAFVGTFGIPAIPRREQGGKNVRSMTGVLRNFSDRGSEQGDDWLSR